MNTTTAAATRLQTAIVCINYANSITHDIIQHTFRQLDFQIGKDTFKNDGLFLKKVNFNKLELPALKVTEYGFDFWIHTNYYLDVKYKEVSLHVNVSVSGGGYDVNGVNKNHHSTSKYISLYTERDGKIIDKIPTDFEYLKVKHIEADILKAEEEVRTAAKAYEAAVKKVYHEFRDILYIKNL